MSKFTLQLIYVNGEGKERMVSVTNPSQNLTAAEVSAAMNTIKSAFTKFADQTLTNKEANLVETRITQTFDQLN
ncbi:DUF2922 domain-containing protein [Kurthia senegalensis]|uniref:DUF2922 domain-containing protein n=1 Tax=Kurthia senegalensis TaxID=1033740 RepID=UPI0002891C93|nr:DUF2922 domain-containing protein [Kurthia senegalensis]